jgi:hypothetical protein
VRYLAKLILVVLIAAPVYADTASELIACGVNNVQATCFENVMDKSYGTLAAAGNATGNAGLITKKVTYVTATDDAKGVRLPTPATGDSYRVYNTVASKNLIVYPVTGGTINAGSANAAVTIYGKTGLECFATSTSAYLCSALVAPTTRTIFIPAGVGRVGTTAGWVNTGTNINQATVAASQTGSTFTIPVTGLEIGDTIVSFKVVGQVESAGGSVTLDADLRQLTNAAADPADASLGAITQVAVTADTAVASSKTLATAELIASGDMPYVLLTATTAGSTDIRLLGVEVVVNRDN